MDKTELINCLSAVNQLMKSGIYSYRDWSEIVGKLVDKYTASVIANANSNQLTNMNTIHVKGVN